ncbi:MAG: class I SAM-dependent methyltransferase [Thermoleophilia bacterium]
MSDDDEARSFAREHGHYTEDLPFWREAARRLGSPVLDLGTAAGRVAIPLARDGAEVWALDSSPAMLAELERRLSAEGADVAARVHPVEGDMRRLDLGRRFRLVMIPMNTLQALVDAGDRLACLRGARDHLEPGGELIFDVALPDVAEIEETIGLERPGGVHRDAESGITLIHSAWYDAWDAASGTLDFTLRVRERGGARRGREVLRRHHVHLFPPDELDALLADAGLRPLQVAGDFDGAPVGPASERQVVRAVAA